jgi:hypothetical protein
MGKPGKQKQQHAVQLEPQQQQPPPAQVEQQATELPPIMLTPKKLRPQVVNDHMVLVPGVLSIPEAQQFINAAEALGFEHQSSRGPAFGEAFRCALTTSRAAMVQYVCRPVR